MTGIVTRKATGLVRAVGPLGLFAFSMFAVNLGMPLTFMILNVPAFYPGADLGISILLTGVLSIFVAFVYWTLSVSMPRSGGDYVFNTRILHPSLGFAFNWIFVMFNLFYGGWAAWGITTMGLSPLFYMLSIQTGDPMFAAVNATLASPAMVFLIGAVLILLTVALFTTGTRRAFQLVTAVFFAAMLTVIVMILLLATSSHETFIASLGRLTGTDYQGVIDTAVGQGFLPNAPFSGESTIYSMVWPWFMFPFAMFTTFFAGEIKDIKKSQFVGLFGAIVFSVLICLLIWYLSLRAFGYEFLGAIGWTYAFPVFPFINVLAGLLTENVVVSAIVAGALALWTYSWIFTTQMISSRSIFAWGIDKILPEVATGVSGRWRTPMVSLVISAAIQMVFLAACSFTPYFATLTGMIGLSAVIAVTGISAILFPYRIKDVYDKSPARIQVGRIPLVSLAGIVVAVSSGYLTYRTIVDDFAFSNNPESVGTVVGLFVSGFVIWIAAYLVRKKQGIDIMAGYRELPIE